MRSKWRLFLFVGLILLLASAVVGCSEPPTENLSTSPSTEQQLAPSTTPKIALEPEPPIPTHFATYTDEASFFIISYPQDWEPFPPSMEKIFPSNKDFFKIYNSNVALEGYLLIFTAESPREPGISGANVNIMVQSLSDMTSRGWLRLDEIVEAKLQRTEEIKQEYHEFSRINTIIGGREAVIIDWESSYPDLGKKARCVQMFMIADKLVWQITCNADSEKYDYFKDDLDALVRSLRILK